MLLIFSEFLLEAEEIFDVESLEVLLEIELLEVDVEVESLEVLPERELEEVEEESLEVLLERELEEVTLELTEFLLIPRPSPLPPRPSWMEHWDSATFMSATPDLFSRLTFLPPW